jgi:hypothetical protein
MTNLQKRDLSQKEAFAVYPKIAVAFEAGDFKEAQRLQGLYESLTDNAIKWELEELSK